MESKDEQNPNLEFNFSVLGCSGVGKTSLIHRLGGTPFSRKAGHKSENSEYATKYSIDAHTSAGLILLNFFDWDWEEKRKEVNAGLFSQQLMRGKDGAIFVYDVTDRRSKNEFAEFSDWYHRSAGFDKPWLIISNKNDQKKRAIQEGEGQALARAGDRRGYVAVSLVDDTGLDEVISTLCKIITNDLNLSVTSYTKASANSINWSQERESNIISTIGLKLPGVKSKRVILVVLNSATAEKFVEYFDTSEYQIERCSSNAECDEVIAASREGKEDGANLPIVAIMVPPTASDSQKNVLTEIGAKYGLPLKVSVPRNAPESVQGL